MVARVEASEPGAQQAPHTETRAVYSIDPQGENLVDSVAPSSGITREAKSPPPPATALQPSQRLWSHADNGEQWIGQCVSIGDCGSQVFTEYEHAADYAELFSAYEQHPASSIWQTPRPGDMVQVSIDSAEDVPVHVTLHQLPIPGVNGQRSAVLSKYRSSSRVPDWQYTFPSPTTGASRVAISRKGDVIVAVVFKASIAGVQIAVFRPDSPVPVSIDSLALGPQLRGFDLSADGSTLYISSHISAIVFDTRTRQTLCNIGMPGGFDSHAISGDGSVFAFGGFNFYEIWQRTATGYAKTFTRNLPGSLVCSRLDLSDDSTTLVAGFNFYDQYLKVHVEALDVPTKTVTMVDEPAGTGTLQNVVADVSVSANGGRFAVGLWGDAGNVCPELRLYARNQNAPVSTFNLTGSVFDVDVSARGDRVAVASKAVHANTFASGGEIGLYSFDAGDLRLRGRPVPGATLELEVSGQIGSAAWVYSAPALAPTPSVFSGLGTLYLRRGLVQTLATGTVGSDGFAHIPLVVPASTVGSTVYLQGFTFSPRRLTRDWLKVTIVP